MSCELGTTRCAHPEQVFVNGEPLLQAASRPGNKQFAVTARRQIVLANSPRRKTVEVTVRRHWITASPGADNVTVQGFTMRHAANEWRSGAIMNREPTTIDSDGSYSWSRLKAGGSDWTVKNNVLTDAHGAIVSVKGSEGHLISGNELARGGQLGIHNAGNDTTIQGNSIYDNNTENFCYSLGECTIVGTDGRVSKGLGIKEAGGVKIAGGQNAIVFDSNTVARNKGNGIWFDVGMHDVAVSGNVVHHNARRGIHFEISSGGTISNNVVYENGWGSPEHVDGAGIGISNSSSVEVHHNTLAWNADGIAVVGFDREGHELVHDVFVHDNTVLAKDWQRPNDGKEIALGWIQGWTDTMFDPANENAGENNDYWYPNSESAAGRFEWHQEESDSLARFNDTPGEEAGQYLSQAEKDMLVATEGIPAQPEAH